MNNKFSIGDIVRTKNPARLSLTTQIAYGIVTSIDKTLISVMWFRTGNTYEYKDFTLMRVYND
jgi:hypothetical protein